MSGAPNPWFLVGLSNHAMQHAMGDLFNATNTASPATPPDRNSTLDNVLLVVKAFLPLLTIVLGVVGAYLIDYFLDNVVFVLASVEAPVPGGVDSETLGAEKRGLLDDDEQTKRPVLKSPKPHFVTSSIRATVRHLAVEAGDLSFFRGIGAESTVRILSIPPAGVLELLVRKYVTKKDRFADGISGAINWFIFAQAYTACTHMVISKPRNKFWFRRLPLSWLRVIYVSSTSVVAIVTAEETIEWTSGKLFPTKPMEHDLSPGSGAEYFTSLISGPVVPLPFLTIGFHLGTLLLKAQIRLVVRLLIMSPLDAIFSRIQASMLPDTDDPIIPMDRQFTGRSQSGMFTPSSPMSFLEAAKTIDKQTFLRLLKLNYKIYVVKQICTWSFWTLVFTEVVWLVGPASATVLLKVLFGTGVTQGDFDALEAAPRSILARMIQVPRNHTATAEQFTAALSGNFPANMTASPRS